MNRMRRRGVSWIPGLAILLAATAAVASPGAAELPPCPAGTSPREVSTSSGREFFCVRPGSGESELKSGPYREWQGFHKLRAEGQYRDGSEDGVWTYYDDMGGKAQQGKFRMGKRDGVWAKWLAADAIELVVFKDGKESSEPVSGAFWKEITPEVVDAEVLCGRFQKALDFLRGSIGDGDPRSERAMGVVVGCRSAAAKRALSKQKDEERKAATAKRNRTDPMWLRFPMSAALCRTLATKSGAMAAIAEEYRDGKIAGVVDRGKLYALQGIVVEQNDYVASIRGAMSRRNVPQVACSDKLVRRLALCYLQTDTTLPESCRDQDVTTYLDVLSDVLD